MKRLIAILLLTAVVLCGCNSQPATTPSTSLQDTTSAPPVLEIFIGENGADQYGVKMMIESIDDKIHARWKNDHGWNIIYGNYYDIEILKGDTWISCRTEDFAVTDIAYELVPGNMANMDYDLAYFDISREGTYRLTAQCSIQEFDQPINCTVWAEFIVGTADSQPVDPDITLLQNVQNCEISAQYVRTDGYPEEAEYPSVTVIRSVSELNAYYEANKDQYDLERKDKVYADTTIGFLDACDKYDDAYFENQALILILLQEGSGSIRHEIHKAGFSGDEFVVSLDSYMPGGVGTADMAQWHIFVEPETDLEIPDKITLFHNGKNSNINSKTVSYSYGYANMTLELLEGWEYSIREYADGCSSFGIEFWPSSYPDNKVSLLYWPNGGFGVCGTGLKEEEVTFANYTCKAGIYDREDHWSYLVYEDLAGRYVAEMFSVGNWWDIYSADAKKMLSGVILADGYIREYRAGDIAQDKLGNHYYSEETAFDSTTGIWTVRLSNSMLNRPDVTVRVDATGNILDITYDE